MCIIILIIELPRDDFFAVVDGVYPKAAEWKEISSIGSYMFLTDDAMDLISQFASLNFLAHFALHSTRYPAVPLPFSLHRSFSTPFFPF